MRKINYSEFDLNGFTEKELQRICRYYDIEVFPEWDKQKLIEEILAYSPIDLVEKTYVYDIERIQMTVNPDMVIAPVENKKSARISRIEDRKEK